MFIVCIFTGREITNNQPAMPTVIVIIICLLILLAYLFDITASKTKIPTVLILFTLGWALQQTALLTGIEIPDLYPLLPSIGTIGLILIVLDGTLELELRKNRLHLIGKAAFTAFLPMVAMSLMLALILFIFNGYNLSDGLLNTIPLAVISSAIAIPSVRHLSRHNREFIVYESSLSDILGILFFNFFALNQIITGKSFIVFIIQMIVMLLLSVATSLMLSWLLSHTRQKIKFIPIILIIIIIYFLSKLLHLPGLLFIMVLGLFLGNLSLIPENRFMRFLKPEVLTREVDKFKDMTSEFTFLIRSIFFILFGFLMKTSDIINLHSLPWSTGIVLLILIIRALQLRLSNMPILPLLFIAPRGLITILLFLSIPATRIIPVINSSVIIQVIILSSLVMSMGAFITETKMNDQLTITQKDQSDEIPIS